MLGSCWHAGMHRVTSFVLACTAHHPCWNQTTCCPFQPRSLSTIVSAEQQPWSYCSAVGCRQGAVPRVGRAGSSNGILGCQLGCLPNLADGKHLNTTRWRSTLGSHSFTCCACTERVQGLADDGVWWGCSRSDIWGCGSLTQLGSALVVLGGTSVGGHHCRHLLQCRHGAHCS